MIRRLKQYRFDWKLSLLTVALLPLLLNLGFWQLRREAEKRDLQQIYEQRLQEGPVPFADLDWAADLQYRQVLVTGQVDDAHVFLLDNRTLQGKAGFEVIVPVLAQDGALMFVNRGWLQGGPSHTDLPSVPAMPTVRNLQASVYQSVGETLLLGDQQENAGWPRVVQSIDTAAMAAAAGHATQRVFPHTLRLAADSPGALPRQWPVLSTSPEKHRGYAVQWFLMATALVLLYLFYSTRPEGGHSPS